MKKTFILIILLAQFSLAYSQSQEYENLKKNKLDVKSGVRDIKLGSPKSIYKDLIFVEDFDYMKWYIRKNENLYIGGLKVNEIRYGYINNILYGIWIFLNESDYIDYLVALAENYGDPDEIFGETNFNKFGIRGRWNCKNVLLEYFSMYDDVKIRGNGYWFYYKKNGWLEAGQKAEKLEKEKLKSDL
ncbi:hypothetical protein [Rufibacter immobilis]|uniref:hypothetical protein n=1 Tax=Rufibacter immobilis TaxID=1348778 RepID=UPI0035EDC565